MAPIPTGTVTFLFTDVEGSTRLWEDDRTSMASSLELHDRILRDAIDRHDGHVFATGGDAFCVAFSSADQATAAALDAQVALEAATWPGPPIAVRMGLHTGTAEERDGDYFGPTLNRAARIMSAGHGRQVLLSATTAALADVATEDRGAHHLKDLREPERIHDLRHPDLPVIDRPLRTLDVRRHNLPAAVDAFIGRRDELALVSDTLREHRLVTLTGVGGTGKTRLATEVGHRLLDEAPDGVWFTPLAPVGEPDLVFSAIGDVWGLTGGEGATVDEVVERHLHDKHLLLVVDNCEHLLEGAADVVQRLLAGSPHLRVLATSREPLGVAGERTIHVPSLAVADDGTSDAVELFIDRARASVVDFHADDAALGTVARICRRVDGIPLGIELAAARLRSLTLADLADRLDDSFRILTGPRTSLPRHRTLDATIGWSYDLLTPEEQVVFRRAAVFAGGFDLPAAEAVCVTDDLEDWQVVDLLDSLVDKSLVLVDRSTATTRYRMLEPVRQYAARQSPDDERRTALLAHGAHFRGWVGSAAIGLRGNDQVRWRRALDLEQDNVRLAQRTLLEEGRLTDHLGMSFDLFTYWMRAGRQLEGMETGQAGLAEATEDPLAQVQVWWTNALMAAEITDERGVEYARSGLELAREVGDPQLVGRMELALGAAIRHATTDPAYLEHLVEGRRLLEAHPTPTWWEPAWERGFHELLLAAYLPNEDDRRDEHYETALRIFEASNDEAMHGIALQESVALLGSVDTETIKDNLRRSIEITGRHEVGNWLGHGQMNLGILTQLEGSYDQALEHLRPAAGHLLECGDLNCWAITSRLAAEAEIAIGSIASARAHTLAVHDARASLPMQELQRPRLLDLSALTLSAMGRHAAAATILGRAKDIEYPPTIMPREETHERVRKVATAALGEDRVAELIGHGEAMSTEDALVFAEQRLREA